MCSKNPTEGKLNFSYPKRREKSMDRSGEISSLKKTRGEKKMGGRTLAQKRLEKLKSEIKAKRVLSNQFTENSNKNISSNPSTSDKFSCEEVKKTGKIKQTQDKPLPYLNKLKVSTSFVNVNANVQKNLYKRKQISSCAPLKIVESCSTTNKKFSRSIDLSHNSYKKDRVLKKDLQENTVSSKELLLTKSDIEPHVELMDWEESNESSNDFELHLQNVRNNVNDDDYVEVMDWQESSPLEINKTPNSSQVHYVVDTNVFISSLTLIRKIREITQGFESVIVIPWQVLKELDCLKTSKKLEIATAARKSISYLLERVSEQSSNVAWQTQQQDSEKCEDFFVEMPDDHIIKCCFQLNKSGHNVVLLSNDKNLRLKALVHKITAVSEEELSDKMAQYTKKQSVLLPLEKRPVGTTELELFTHKLTNLIKTFLGNVVQKHLMKVHGNLWLWYLPGKPPLSLKTSLEILRNISAEVNIASENTSIVDEITLFFNRRTYNNLNSTEVDSIARKCLRFAKSLTYNNDFRSLILQFEDDLGFIKSREPSSNISFNELCCKLTIHHFQLFESAVIGFCFKLAEVLEINFSCSALNEHPLILPNNFDIKALLNHIKTLRVMHTNLERLRKIESSNIFTHTRGILTVYNTLVSYIEEVDNFFTPEDVVEFCSNDSVRSSLPKALQFFSDAIDFLEEAKCVAVKKNML